MKRFLIKTFGCKVNSYESLFIRNLFISNNYEEVIYNADVIIVNTCSVTNEANNKCKRYIRSVRKENPSSILVVMGCASENEKENILIDADIIIGTKDKSKILSYVEEYQKNKKQIIKFYDALNRTFEDMEINNDDKMVRTYIKVQDGCNNYCSYCIIPYLRGNLRSKDKDKVIKEINNVNHKEVILTGIHTGKYYDEKNNYHLSDLIKEIFDKTSLERLRLSSIEVVEINDDILSLLKNDRFMPHLHIPLQSGCDKTLKNMNRRYNTKEYEEIINKIKTIKKDISITTDLIVGFPGETEEDFIESYNFCKKMNFTKIHVFPYSDRNNTVASKMNDKVPGNIKKDRVRKILELSNNNEKEYFNKFINTTLKVLIESREDNYSIGRSENYLKLKLNSDYEVGKIYEILIDFSMFMLS